MIGTGGDGGFAVVDVETTGFSAARDRIVEVAVVLLDPRGEEVGAFCTLLDPGRDPGPTHVHGITAPMLAGAPTFGAVHPYLAHLLSGRVVVGHNAARFDLGFLREECRRLGPDRDPGAVPVVDTMVVAREQLGLHGRATLVDCCDHFGLSWDDHHSALADARVTAALLGSLRDHLGDDRLGLAGALAAAAGTGWPGARPAPPARRERPAPLPG